MKGVEENGEMNEELKVKSSKKAKTEIEIEIIKLKQQPGEETTTQKEYHVISENIIKRGVESKITFNKIAYNMSLNEQENSSQMKQKTYHKLIHENVYHTKIWKQSYLKTKQSQQIEIPDVGRETNVEDKINNKKNKSTEKKIGKSYWLLKRLVTCKKFSHFLPTKFT